MYGTSPAGVDLVISVRTNDCCKQVEEDIRLWVVCCLVAFNSQPFG